MSDAQTRSLCVVPGEWAICRFPAGHPVPAAPPQHASRFFSVTQTADEVSVVCEASAVPPGAAVAAPWSLYRIEGTLDLDLVGVMHGLSKVLAARGISVFVVSTFDTDYLLVPADRAAEAADAWRSAGHRVTDADAAPG
jgi:uncharacterized protein